MADTELTQAQKTIESVKRIAKVLTVIGIVLMVIIWTLSRFEETSRTAILGPGGPGFKYNDAWKGDFNIFLTITWLIVPICFGIFFFGQAINMNPLWNIIIAVSNAVAVVFLSGLLLTHLIWGILDANDPVKGNFLIRGNDLFACCVPDYYNSVTFGCPDSVTYPCTGEGQAYSDAPYDSPKLKIDIQYRSILWMLLFLDFGLIINVILGIYAIMLTRGLSKKYTGIGDPFKKLEELLNIDSNVNPRRRKGRKKRKGKKTRAYY